MATPPLPAPPPDVPPHDGAFTTSDGAVIPYRRRGDGPPLLMIHGWSQSGAMFAHQLAALSARMTVVVPDLRGHGGARRPAGGLRMARLAQDLHELMSHLGIQRASMLGWSLGASVLWAFVDLFGTAAIDRLILVDQPVSLMATGDMDDQTRIDTGALFTYPALDTLAATLRGPGGNAARDAFVDGMVTKGIGAPLLAWIKAENALTPADLAADLLVSHCMHDWRDVLDRIDRPTLVIGGSVSHVDPRSQRYIHRRIAGSAYHEFGADEGGAHFAFLEAPEAFNRVVAGFLA